VLAVFALVCAACRDDHVVLAYHPTAGATYTYDVHVESSSSSTFPGHNSSPRDVADLQVRQRVLDANGQTIRVEVTLGRVGVGERAFVMRFDRAAQLTAVESVEGIPAEEEPHEEVRQEDRANRLAVEPAVRRPGKHAEYEKGRSHP